MSYTLRGRLQSRLAAAVLPFLVACGVALALAEWWPVELAGAMVAVGLVFDVVVYHRPLAYQPAWVALPLGFVELVATVLLARELGIDAPRAFAIPFFVASWLLAQVLAHAILPFVRLSYGEDGGELAGPAGC